MVTNVLPLHCYKLLPELLELLWLPCNMLYGKLWIANSNKISMGSGLRTICLFKRSWATKTFVNYQITTVVCDNFL